MKPTISVIIPNYNRENLIGETLDNMLRQSRAPDEIIVVDDGSTDGSAAVIDSFGERVKLLRQRNSGPAVARNRGLDAATGDFVQLFDSDDLCSLNKLEVQSDALEKSGADFVYGPWLKVQLADGRASYDEPVLQQRGLPENASALSWFLRGWVAVFQACMFRRSFLERIGRYRADLMPSEDSEYLFRMLKAGGRGVHVPDALVLYRFHETNQITSSGMSAERRKRDWVRFSEIVAGQLDAAGEPVGRLDRLRWRATVWAAHSNIDCANEQRALATEFSRRFGPAEAMLCRLLNEAKRIHGGVRARLQGSRVPSYYRAGELTDLQRRQILDLGYEPIASGNTWAK
jgi:glycosyltransferase involved in cell wall biosynthesis